VQAGQILALLLWRVPETEIVPLIHWMVETVGTIYYLGYLLFVITVFAWYFHAQRVRAETTAQFNAFKSGQRTAAKRTKGATK
jgi:hypothetical protein